MDQVSIKHTSIFNCQDPPKFTQICIFGLLTNHLATLVRCDVSYPGIIPHTWEQGCQMVYFQTKNPNLGGSWNWKCWYILWPSGICYGRVVKFMAVWYSLWHCCLMVYFQTKNPNLDTYRKVLQWNILIHFMAIGLFYGHLVYFVTIWYVLW
jgi:hypothetical protein